MKTYTVVTAIREFFGQKAGQSLKEFVDEIKALPEADKHWLASEAAKQLGGTLVTA